MALAACGGDQPAGPGNGPGSPGISAAAARSPAGRIRTLDDDLSDLAGEIPGFGGVFYDENGTLMVRLKDEGQMATARGRVEAFLTRRAQGNSARMAQVAREVGGMRALPAQYDFRELRAMYLRDVVPVARVEDGVTMTDIDEHQNRLVIGVRDAGVIPAMTDRLRARGLPAEAFEVRQFDPIEIGPVSVQDGECDPELAIEGCEGGTGGGGGATTFFLNDVVRPAAGGLRIEFLDASFQPRICTLGYNARLNLGSDPTRYFITNAHCGLEFGSATSQMPMGQPDLAHLIATEVADPPTFTAADDSRCPSGRQCRYSDAALFRYNDPATSNHGKVAETTQDNTLGMTGLATVYSDYDPLGGPFTTRKMGSISGQSSGGIVQTCADVPQTQRGMDTGRTLLCQVVASYPAKAGDSGSPVFYFFSSPPNALITVLGLHWGGNNQSNDDVATITVFSPISAVKAELERVPGFEFGIDIIGG